MRLYHLDRGYEDLDVWLQKLGGRVERVPEEARVVVRVTEDNGAAADGVDTVPVGSTRPTPVLAAASAS